MKNLDSKVINASMTLLVIAAIGTGWSWGYLYGLENYKK